ncbi:MAG: FAD-dependent oxidoreductase [Alphaproteobacteria bacterium]
MANLGSTDVLIVGGGIVGAATAYFLSQRRRRVTLIDAKYPGFGASGRNGGYIWLHYRAPGPQLQLALASRAIYDSFVKELDDFEFRPSGGMTYFFDEHKQLFKEIVEERQAAGLPMQLLSREEARQMAPILPDTIAGSTFNPLDAYMNTAKLVQALVLAAERNGAKVVSGLKVTGLDIANGTVRGVKTTEGTFGADVTVLAAGTWVGEILEPHGIKLPIKPERMQTIELGKSDIQIGPAVYGPLAIKLYNCVHSRPSYRDELVTHPLERANPGVEFLEGISQRRDGRVWLGWACDQPGFDDRTTMAGLNMMLSVFHDRFPALRNLPIERSWACILPTTPDALPILGPADGLKGLVLGAGHSFGNSGGPISGKLLAQHINGESLDMDLAPFRFDRPSLKPLPSGVPLRY